MTKKLKEIKCLGNNWEEIIKRILKILKGKYKRKEEQVNVKKILKKERKKEKYKKRKKETNK